MNKKRISGFIYGWLAKWRRRSFLVGTHRITLPPGHRLDEYQRAFLNYDRKLPVIARLVSQKYAGAVTLDVGANIGDSAAAIRSVVDGPILCVEGNAEFLPYLKENLELLPGTNRIIPNFIRPTETDDIDFLVRTRGGTAHLIPGHREIPDLVENHTTTLREILASNANLGPVKLFKIDTDGFDFAIILGAMDSFALHKPVLFFEFDTIIGNSNASAGIAAIKGLIESGYCSAVVFDNYGNYLAGVDLTSELAQDLASNLAQRHRAGGGAVYFDLCCFSAADTDIFHDLVEHERSSIERR